VVDADGNSAILAGAVGYGTPVFGGIFGVRLAEELQGIADYQKNLKIRRSAVTPYDVKVTLGKFSVPSPLGVFSPPDFGDMVPLEGQVDFISVFRRKTGKGNGKVETEGYIPPSVIGKTVYLFFRFPAAFAKEYFRIFQRRSVNWYKAKGSERMFDFFDHSPAHQFLTGKEIPKTFKNAGFYDGHYLTACGKP
jgi:hypothetical protein